MPAKIKKEDADKPAEEINLPSDNTLTFTFNPTIVIIILIILVAGGLLFYLRSVLIAAYVNDKPISRLSIIERLEKQGGKRELEMLINQTLIEADAQKRKIDISEREIDKRFNLI